MSTLSDLLAEHTTLSGSSVAHLQRLVSEWQLLADLSFSDLTLWAPAARDTLLCVAQVRPTTGATAYVDDLVSLRIAIADEPLLGRAWGEQRSIGADAIDRSQPLSSSAIPVRSHDRVVAILRRDTFSSVGLESSQLEHAYVDVADDLLHMVSDGTFPPPDQPTEMHTGPRAGDGLLRLDADGLVVYVSPNALSAYHRLAYTGEVLNQDLAQLTRRLLPDTFDGAELAGRITGAVQGRASLRMEVEAKAATVLFRALPLRPRGQAVGALVLVRDVTEVRRRDRALLSKDATIREIHHRVKNNLQTVAALLRMQGRRSGDPAVRQALAESMRRVSSIALVHETLSTSPDDRVDLDQIVDRLVPMISDVAAAENSARVRRNGSFGVVGAELATPLIMVLAEVVQNALQHAFGPSAEGGLVLIDVERTAKYLDVTITDDGYGLPPAFSLEKATGLGLQIVRTLVESELLGSIGMRRRPDRSGTEVMVRVPLRGRG